MKSTNFLNAVAWLSGCVVAVSIVSTGCSGGAAPFEETQSFAGIEEIIVDGSYFEVEVIGHSQSSVDTEITIPDRIRRRGVTVTRETTGSTLEIRVEGRRWGSGFFVIEQPRIKIGAPYDTMLQLKTSSGSIEVEEISTQAIDLKASSGRINATECDGDLSAESSSGRIVIESCSGPKTISSSSGRIEVKDSDGDIEAESSSGRQTYDEIAGSISTSSSSGKILVGATKGALDIRNNSGGIRGTNVTITADSSFQTSSGSINIDFTNDLDDFAMKLESSSGRIKAGRTSAKGTVVTGNGDIRIHGKSSSGRQTYE
jgi:hypothetical protein